MQYNSEIIDTPIATICRMVVLPLPREMEGTYAIVMRLRAHHFTKLSHSLWIKLLVLQFQIKNKKIANIFDRFP